MRERRAVLKDIEQRRVIVAGVMKMGAPKHVKREGRKLSDSGRFQPRKIEQGADVLARGRSNPSSTRAPTTSIAQRCHAAFIVEPHHIAGRRFARGGAGRDTEIRRAVGRVAVAFFSSASGTRSARPRLDCRSGVLCVAPLRDVGLDDAAGASGARGALRCAADTGVASMGSRRSISARYAAM